MIVYKKCSEVSKEIIFDAFNIGFEDYIVQIKMPIEFFFERFFGPEGNKLEYSFIALDENRPVGLILGGIKVYDGLKTMRCGALCVDNEYRGRGISQELFSLHKEIALYENCDRLFLEVIKGNDRAIKFYEKMGYKKIHDLIYYSCNDFSNIKPKDYIFKQLEFINFKNLNKDLEKIHINWQNDLDYLEKIESIKYFGAFDNESLMGSMAISLNGKIAILYVHPKYRKMGVGSNLIKYAKDVLNLNAVQINYPDNVNMGEFLEKIGFMLNSLGQFEMEIRL